MPLTIVRTLLTAAAVWLLLSGCGSEEPAATSPETAEAPAEAETPADAEDANRAGPAMRDQNTIVEKMDPDGKGMHLSATTSEGKTFQASIGDKVDLPENFPDDVPIFPGATPMAAMSSVDEGLIVTFKTTSDQQAVFDFYQSNLAQHGWTLLEDSVFDNPLSIDATKDQRKVSVIIAGTEGDSRVSVMVVPQI